MLSHFFRVRIGSERGEWYAERSDGFAAADSSQLAASSVRKGLLYRETIFAVVFSTVHVGKGAPDGETAPCSNGP